MVAREIRLESLLNRAVRDRDGRRIGPLEEATVEDRDGRCVLVEYRVGTYALLQRLAGSSISRALLHAFGLARTHGAYRVRWDQLDLSDPSSPRLRCPVSALEIIDDDADDDARH